MKKYIAPVLVAMLAIATSCTKGQNAPVAKGQEYEIVFFNTVEDINNFLLEGLPPYTTKITDGYSTSQETKTDVPVQMLPLYGYDYMISEGDKKGLFAKEAADAIGIAPGIYIVARERYCKKFRLSQWQYILSGYPADHSKCGYMPTATSQNPTRGFCVGQNGAGITLTTLIIHVKSDAGTGYATEVYSPLGYKGIGNLTWHVPYIKA